MTEPLDAVPLSVIIPTYNRSAMVQECVRSLLTCGLARIEVVVVDDGSTDDTEARVRGMGEGVVYLRQQNQGPAAARNLGFRRSAGRCVAFLDDDDRWLPEVPTKVVGLLDHYPEVDAVFANAVIAAEGKPPMPWLDYAAGPALFQLPHRQPESGFHVFERAPLFRRMAERNPIFIGAFVMRRDAFERAGMFDTELRGAADWELWLRMASQMTLACWTEPLAFYQRHEACMANDLDHMQAEFCRALAKCLSLTQQLGPAEIRHVRSCLYYAYFAHGYQSYDRGDYVQARKLFLSALAESRFRLRPTLYYLLCLLPFGLPGVLRKMKQTIFPPT